MNSEKDLSEFKPFEATPEDFVEDPQNCYILDNLHTVDIGVGETGVTVRLGAKWWDRLLSYLSADQVPQVETSGKLSFSEEKAPEIRLQETIEGVSEIVGSGEVREAMMCRFRDIPARLLEIEHEEESRTYSGLLASMERAYGDDFSEDSRVTVFTYVRVE